MKKLIFVLALICAGLIPVWIFLITPKIVARIPDGWVWKTNYIGYNASPDPQTNKWMEKSLSLYDREKKVIAMTKGRAVIKDKYTTYEPITGKTTWEYITEYVVNPQSGLNIEGKDRTGYYYVFPMHTEKKEYILSSDYIKKVPLSFVKEELLEGLRTYLFEFRGITEYTECYQGTADYKGIIPPKGQEIRSSETLILRFWVEPVSGEIVKVEEDCPDGDWIVDASTDKAITPVLIWGGKTTGDSIIQLVNSVRKRKEAILFQEKIAPAIFALLAVIFSIAGLSLRGNKK